MDDVKKINLLDATKEQVYHDKFGWVSGRLSVYVSGKINQSRRFVDNKWELQQLYIKDDKDQYRNFATLVLNNRLNNHQLFDCDFSEIYYKDYYSSYHKIEYPKASFFWAKIEITKNSQIDVYEGEKREVELKDWQIKEGMRVQIKGKMGTYVVVKLIQQPNRENELCVAEPLIKGDDIEAEAITIKCNQKVLYSVPYEIYEDAPDETSIFSQPLNENLLAPFVEKTANESKDANLYWLPIENASNYIVSFYKRRNAEQQKYNIYFLQRFEIDRNQHWFTFHNLIGSGYIAILEAESRDGSVIARTRGINLNKQNIELF